MSDLAYHEARVLILVSEFSSLKEGLQGLTKLAKLDFLLRYPGYLDRLIRVEGRSWPKGCKPSLDELIAAESKMMRYKYGPWDDRYYSIIGRLISRGFVVPVPGRGKVNLKVTEDGKSVVERVLADEHWSVIGGRARFLRSMFSTLTGNALKEKIYRAFPDALDRPYRSVIQA